MHTENDYPETPQDPQSPQAEQLPGDEKPASETSTEGHSEVPLGDTPAVENISETSPVEVEIPAVEEALVSSSPEVSPEPETIQPIAEEIPHPTPAPVVPEIEITPAIEIPAQPEIVEPSKSEVPAQPDLPIGSEMVAHAEVNTDEIDQPEIEADHAEPSIQPVEAIAPEKKKKSKKKEIVSAEIEAKPDENQESEEEEESESSEGFNLSTFDYKGFFEQNKTNVLAGAGIILAAIIYFVFFNTASPDAEDEAGNAIFTAVKYFEQDSFNLALNGDGQNSGFLELADEFSGTKAGNLCNYYIAVSYLRQGNANEAYSFFDAFDKGENFLSVSAYSAMASIKEDQSDLEGAAEYYEKAASIKANSSTTPFLWQQAARCYEMAENKDAALKLYLRIKNEYPSSTEAQQVDKYIARISPDDLDSEI